MWEIFDVSWTGTFANTMLNSRVQFNRLFGSNAEMAVCTKLVITFKLALANLRSARSSSVESPVSLGLLASKSAAHK